MYNKVYVEITNVCNMNCSFCHGHKRPPKQMTTAEFSHILNQLVGKTNYIYYHLMGEPLTHPLLPDFLILAKNKGFKSIITTNGTLLLERSKELLSSGVHKVNVSLHSFENGSDESLTNYVKDIANFAKDASKLGTIVVFRLWNDGFDCGKNETIISLLKSAFKGEWAENSRGIKIDNNIYLEYGKRFKWPDESEEIQGERFFCYGLKDQFGILVDGSVVPCCLDSEGVINLGNIFKQDIESILNCDRAVKMVDGFRCGKASEELCKRCGYAQRFIK
ncbi:MAG: radical SAM protein [Clostridia bacterium]|nr:radical SAM protein [Clostridia bacterium]